MLSPVAAVAAVAAALGVAAASTLGPAAYAAALDPVAALSFDR
jgi:ABC-type antimicrobial peptide transport system permease subunit